MSIREPLERDVIRYFAEVAGRARSGLEQDLKRAAPVNTGRTRDETSVSVRREGHNFRLTARCAVDYASFTSKPTRPHVIRPRRSGGILAFEWPQAGGLVFFRFTRHPGTRGTGWWEQTLDSFPEIVQDSL